MLCLPEGHMTKNIRGICGKFGVAATFAAVIISGLAISAGLALADNDKGKDKDNGNGLGKEEALKIQVGFRAVPVPLNLVGKDRDLVYLGSYIVNVQSECNGCH